MGGDRDLHRDRGRALSFGAQAERYHRTRPRYPVALREALLTDGPAAVLDPARPRRPPAVLDPARQRRPPAVLDVGCGTGIVAELLAGSGASLLGVEPDPEMAALARRAGVAVEEATFEAWDRRGRTFDLLTAGQAWHWVDPDVGARRALEALRPGGRFAAFWHFGTPEPRALEALQAVYARRGLDVDRGSVVLGGGSTHRLEVTAAGLRGAGFEEPEVRSWPREERVTADEWADALPTHSDHAALPRDELDGVLADVRAAVEGLGGAFALRYDLLLVAARRPPG